MNGENIYNSWNHYDYSTNTTYSSRKKDNSEYQRNSILAMQQKLNRLGYKGKNGKNLTPHEMPSAFPGVRSRSALWACTP